MKLKEYIDLAGVAILLFVVVGIFGTAILYTWQVMGITTNCH